MSDEKKGFISRNGEDRRGPTDRRVLNMGFGPRGKDRRRKKYERRKEEERRKNWERASKWSSILKGDKE